MAVGLVGAACGSGPSPGGASQKTADVAYAGSLELLNEKTIGPAFTKATGYGYEGRGGGSFGVAQEIVSKEISPDVFESIGAAPIALLEPKFTSWCVEVAASPIVVAYNPDSPFASQLREIAIGRLPLPRLFSLMAQPGFHLGRTNPNTDPQGQAFYEMVELAQTHYHLATDTTSKVLGSLDNPSQVFAETALEARLEAGQLDAASAFLSQAIQLHLPYIKLPSGIDFGDPSLASMYAKASVTLSDGKVADGVPLIVDATVLSGNGPAAGASFVSYLLSPAGRNEFVKGGYSLVTPKILGDASAAPKVVRDAVASA